MNRRLGLLLEAEESCNQAKTEASKWFGLDSRRTVRIAKKRGEIATEVQNLLLTMSELKL